MKKHSFLLHSQPFEGGRFLPSNAPIMLYKIPYRWFFVSQGYRWTKYLVHTKIRRPKMVDLCFIRYHIFTKKILFAPLKQLQTTLWIVDTLLFLINRKQTWHPLRTQFSRWQKFMQNGEYTAFWYIQLLCFLLQLQFTVSQKELWSFLFFSEKTAEFGQLELLASFVSVQLRLKSA